MMKKLFEEDVGQLVTIPAGDLGLEGNLIIPEKATGLVLFAHGSGSSRHSVRNCFVATTLNEHGLATLLMDLLSADEEAVDLRTSELRFDIAFLARRLALAMDWLKENEVTKNLKMGLFGSSTGGGAALVAAAQRPRDVGAVVSRGGRPDLAESFLPSVRCPTLFIVGGKDYVVIDLNEKAFAELRCPKEMKIIPGATHLFAEPGALDEVARLAGEWFSEHLSTVD